MTTRTSATRYARALLDVLLKESTAEQGGQDLAKVASLLEQFPELQRAFNNPAIPNARRHALVQELLPKLSLTVPVGKLLLLLAERGRLTLLPDLIAVYQERLEELQQIVRAEVTTAEPLAPRTPVRTPAAARRATGTDGQGDDQGGSRDHRRREDADRQHGVRRQHRHAARSGPAEARKRSLEAEMDIRAEEISKIIRDQIGSFAVTVDVAEVGTVISIGDGIARVHGVERAMAGEMIEFPKGVFGIALNLEEDSVGTVLLGDYKEIKEGDQVKRTGRIISGAGRRCDARPRRQRARPAD
jgi:F-type H+-transporting ATPase subunit alpha